MSFIRRWKICSLACPCTKKPAAALCHGGFLFFEPVHEIKSAHHRPYGGGNDGGCDEKGPDRFRKGLWWGRRIVGQVIFPRFRRGAIGWGWRGRIRCGQNLGGQVDLVQFDGPLRGGAIRLVGCGRCRHAQKVVLQISLSLLRCALRATGVIVISMRFHTRGI